MKAKTKEEQRIIKIGVACLLVGVSGFLSLILIFGWIILL
jgi:hypothetical protein